MKPSGRIGPLLAATLAAALTAGTVSGALIGMQYAAGAGDLSSWVGFAMLGVFVGWFYAGLLAAAIGLPAYLIAGRPPLRRRVAALAGALIICVPALVQAMPGGPSAQGIGLSLAELVLGGALGGLAFRGALRVAAETRA
ncbi:hypothetical protein [Sphingomonas sp. KR3-1]|uniref:hypothetical protein n=1 Tax=Sphingomonas sp. KR3-1 TaxID=3156611 RepID=UPI0032B410BE